MARARGYGFRSTGFVALAGVDLGTGQKGEAARRRGRFRREDFDKRIR
jgi:hypothetical protein